MGFDEQLAEELVKKYVKEGQVIAFGSSEHGEKLAKKLALEIEEKGMKVQVVPTSLRIAEICHDMNVPTTTIDEHEIDIAVEFVDLVNGDFDFIKQESHSLVRDKMVAQSAAELIVVVGKEGFVKKLKGRIPFEVSVFGWKHTLVELEKFGKASARKENGQPVKTETNHYLIDVEVDEVFDLNDLEYEAKKIPGVLETGLFEGYADRVLLHSGKKIEMKSRMQK